MYRGIVLDCRIPFVGEVVVEDWGKVEGSWFHRDDSGRSYWMGRMHVLIAFTHKPGDIRRALCSAIRKLTLPVQAVRTACLLARG